MEGRKVEGSPRRARGQLSWSNRAIRGLRSLLMAARASAPHNASSPRTILLNEFNAEYGDNKVTISLDNPALAFL